MRPYNPLDKHNIGESIVQKLIASECRTLPYRTQSKSESNRVFEGAGIYAIYYYGGFDLYAEQALVNRNNGPTVPIYIGKAEPRGGRKGNLELDSGIGTALFDRLKEHAKSIEDASNLEVPDFCCRFLVVDDVWIGLAERLAIQQFLPLWNTLIDGFGNHDPGRRRVAQYRSDWDVLHPGRRWASKLGAGPSTDALIRKKVEERHTTRELQALAAASENHAEGN